MLAPPASGIKIAYTQLKPFSPSLPPPLELHDHYLILTMSTLTLSTIRQNLSKFNFNDLSIPGLVLLIMGMLVIPLHPMVLDVLFTFNIAAALLIIMIAIKVRKPLEFSSFPSVLLFATMLRLALNVASTRVILVNGHEGHDAAG